MTPKFRGWDRKEHKMYDFMFMCFGVNLKNVFYRNQMTDFDIELYTGLNDIENLEIYENDIVQPVRVIDDDIADYHATQYIGEPFVVERGNYVNGKWIAREVAETGFGATDWNDGNTLKVIGNIHENPELLK